MSPIEPVLSLRRGVALAEAGPRELAVDHPWGRTVLGGIPPVVRHALAALADGGATENHLANAVLAAGTDLADLPCLYYVLGRLRRHLLLHASLVVDGAPVLRVEPIAAGTVFAPKPVDPDRPHRLSRFVFLRRLGEDFVLESPAAPVRMTLLAPIAPALVAELAAPRCVRELAARFPGLDEAAVAATVAYLTAGGLAGETGEAGVLAEDRVPTLMAWEFHDLLFHSRSRGGHHDYPIGGTFPFLGTLPPLPAVKPPMPGELVALFVPDLEASAAADPPFTRVLEGRRSVRDYGAAPISARQLGELLFRAARVRSVYGPWPERGMPYEASSRPYPTGGAAYDLEVYVTAGQCEGLARGIYHYDPQGHGLRLVNSDGAMVDALLGTAWISAARTVVPQVLLTLTSRHLRLSWKYRGIAYATTLKNVGVLYQTLYLVATAMGLAPCGLGSGNSALFAAATGLDAFEESAVGDFMLGSAPAVPDSPADV